MPCYNCEDTLLEAVESIFFQNLQDPFEVVMVDDGSTDSTRKLIVDLEKKHQEVRYVFHETNQGGGAARNTGIKESKGELIFCLDSDNFFSENVLQKMIDDLEKDGVDGVVIHDRRFFRDDNHGVYSSHHNPVEEQPFSLSDLFNASGLLLDNFLFTRAAYDKTLGYPVRHGFDTQCFEFRFLAAGNKVKTSAGSVFYHRQVTKGKSYFQRVYEQGMFSVNFYLIFEEILPLLSDSIIIEILNFDIFHKNKLGENNIKNYLEFLYKEKPKAFFFDERGDAVRSKEVQLFLDGVSKYKQGLYQGARDDFLRLQRAAPGSKVLQYDLARTVLASEGVDVFLVEERAAYYGNLKPRRRKMYWSAPLLVLLLDRIKRIMKTLWIKRR